MLSRDLHTPRISAREKNNLLYKIRRDWVAMFFPSEQKIFFHIFKLTYDCGRRTVTLPENYFSDTGLVTKSQERYALRELRKSGYILILHSVDKAGYYTYAINRHQTHDRRNERRHQPK